ncbi:hypothetical protein [Halorussus aquaticus]|nr:hypothetical protein [Halorussus aquaticus]
MFESVPASNSVTVAYARPTRVLALAESLVVVVYRREDGARCV